MFFFFHFKFFEYLILVCFSGSRHRHLTKAGRSYRKTNVRSALKTLKTHQSYAFLHIGKYITLNTAHYNLKLKWKCKRRGLEL